MNLYEHAKSELDLIYSEELLKDDISRTMYDNILQLIEVFSKQGHSGHSASYCAGAFNQLAKFEILTPIVDNSDEWNAIDSDMLPNKKNTLFQNNRISTVFKENGRSYYLDAIVWTDDDGCSFTGTVENIKSRQFIKFPFMPKTFHIDIVKTYIDKNSVKDCYEEDGKYYIYKIKDKKQLEDVFKY